MTSPEVCKVKLLPALLRTDRGRAMRAIHVCAPAAPAAMDAPGSLLNGEEAEKMTQEMEKAFGHSF